MNRYTGSTCPVCGRIFTDQDDIVVCAQCGAPHHRECYAKEGRCALEAQHAPGFEWRRPAPEPPPRMDGPQAAGPGPQAQPYGQEGPADYRGRFEPGADQRQYQGQYQNPAYQAQSNAPNPFAIHPDDKLKDIPMRDIAQFVGPNAFYYLPRFKLFSMSGKYFMPNFSALFFSFFYYFNRKMYKLGTACLALFLLSTFPVLVVVYHNFPEFFNAILSGGDLTAINLGAYNGLILIGNIFNHLYLLSCLLSFFFANRLYYGHVMKQVAAIRQEFEGRADQDVALALAVRGRTNKTAVVLLIVVLIIAYFAYELLLLSSYQIL